MILLSSSAFAGYYTYASWAQPASPGMYRANYNHYTGASSGYSTYGNSYGSYQYNSMYSRPSYYGYSGYSRSYSIYSNPQYYGHSY